jgi:Dolichyl-phosphate-mannose-protein mannosyltransferase
MLQNGDPEAAFRQGRAGWQRPLLVCLAILGGLALVAGAETARLLNDPKTFFLRSEGRAAWIRLDQQFLLTAYPATPTGLVFEHTFRTGQATKGTRLTVRAFRRCVVRLDSATIYVGPENLDDWQAERSVRLPDPLPPGDHLLEIAVLNRDAQPCLLAFSDELGIHTEPGWTVVQPDGRRSPSIVVTERTQPEVAQTYPSISASALHVAPVLATVFAITFAWSLWNSRAKDPTVRRQSRPQLVRWGLLAAWLLLAANNMGQVQGQVGFDMTKHLDYVRYIVEHRSLPLANQGWEMFQPPLFYLVEAPWYALLTGRFDAEVVARILRFVPLLCGLIQIEIVYRTARTVFPERNDLQTIATLVGGLCPVQIYVSQVIGNEPLAGVLTAITVLFCIKLLVEPMRARSVWYFAGLGLVWGLAILTKVTPLILAPLIIAAVIVHCRGVARPVGQTFTKRTFVDVAVVCGVGCLTSGWFFLRNLAHLGKSFVGNWDPEAGSAWWQEPSYRTWSQLTSFGTSLSRPMYSGIWSFWDGLYSSLWLDGFVSGRVLRADEFPWNVDWVLCGAWLGLVPTALLAMSLVSCWRSEFEQSRKAILLSMAAIAIYLAATAEFFVRVPIYSTANARFMLGLVPCIGVLASVGAAPLLRFRVLRALIFALLACWAVAAYVAYFVPDALRGLLFRAS